MNTRDPADDSPGILCESTALSAMIDEGLPALIDKAPDGIILADRASGVVVAVNDTAIELLGRSREDLIGIPQRELHPPEEHRRCEDLFEAVASRGNGAVCQYDDGSQVHILTGAGKRIPVEINVTLIEVNDRLIVQGHFRDISNRLERERLVRMFQEAVDHAGHSIFITDISGRIEYVNPAFEEITGYEADEVLGERPSILKSGVHDRSVYQDLWSTILSGQVWEGELINESKHGDRYHVEQTIAPIFDATGEIERFVAVNIDITDRMDRQRQLLFERERLQEFAGTVAHDLRTPLSVALGHLDLAADAHDSPELEQAVESLDRMRSLIDELLTLSTQGRTVDQPEAVQLVDAARAAWSLVDSGDATLIVTIDDDLEVYADRHRLVQLLQNLFENSIIHGGTGVTVRISPLKADSGFAIADDGPGVDPADRVRIFDSGVSLNDGTGYGLAIVQQIVRAHGWQIMTVEDRDLGGARFEIFTDRLVDPVA